MTLHKHPDTCTPAGRTIWSHLGRSLDGELEARLEAAVGKKSAPRALTISSSSAALSRRMKGASCSVCRPMRTRSAASVALFEPHEISGARSIGSKWPPMPARRLGNLLADQWRSRDSNDDGIQSTAPSPRTLSRAMSMGGHSGYSLRIGRQLITGDAVQLGIPCQLRRGGAISPEPSR